MKKISMAFSWLVGNKGMVLLISVEMVITLIAFNFFAARLQCLIDLRKTYNDLHAERIWTSNQNAIDHAEQSIPDSLIQFGSEKQIILLPKGVDYPLNHDHQSITVWPKEFYQYFQLDLYQGDWMYNIRNDCLNVIVPRDLVNKYKVGQTYTVNAWYKTNGIGGSKQISQTIYVCGVLKNNIVPMPGGSVSYSGKQLLGLDTQNTFEGIYSGIPSYFFYETKPLNEIEKEIMLSFAFPMTESREANEDTLLISLKLPIVLSVAVLCFSLAAFLGYNLLSFIQNEKRTAVYYLCGAKLRDIICVKLLHDVFLLTIPLLISSIIIYIGRLQRIFPPISPYSFWGSLMVTVLFFGIPSISTLWNQSKRPPISYMKRWL